MAAQEGYQYRVQGVEQSGKSVQIFITADSIFDARKKAKFHPKLRQGKVSSVKKKKNYFYRVRQGKKEVTGYHTAYSRQEVVSALTRVGLKVHSVRREFDFRFAAASNEIVSFVGTSARLLEQKLPYNEVLHLMANNVTDKNLKNALREILVDLKNGVDSREVFIRQNKVFGIHTALMLGIASKSGDMKSIFKSVAQLVERQAEFKKGLLSSLILPGVTSLTLVGAIAFYVIYLLPKMANMLGPLMGELPPLTASTLKVSEFLQAHMTFILVGSVLLIGGIYAYILSPKGKYQFHRYVIRVPYIGKILQNTSAEIFCRVLGILYTSAGENIESIQLAAEASGNSYLSAQIKTVAIPMMLKYGTELSSALEATNFFPEMFLSRFKTASETGAVKDTAVQLADFYQMENQYAMKNLVSIIEVTISLVIMAALMFLTMLSSETASIDIQGH